MSAVPWTPERLALVEREWLAGNSGQVIANMLGGGVTRNAVIGQVHRNGWKRRPNLVVNGVHGALIPSQTYRARRDRGEIPPKVKAATAPAHRAPSLPRAIAQPQPVVCLDFARPFMSRASRECAWILDDGHSCCGPVTRGSYCAGHAAQVYRPTKGLAVEKMARTYG